MMMIDDDEAVIIRQSVILKTLENFGKIRNS